MSEAIRPFQTTPEKLRESAQRIEIDGTPSQIGMSPAELRDAANEMERMRTCLDNVFRDIEREGYEVLNTIDGGNVVIRRKPVT
jgi:hypothetical protein